MLARADVGVRNIVRRRERPRNRAFQALVYVDAHRTVLVHSAVVEEGGRAEEVRQNVALLGLRQARQLRLKILCVKVARDALVRRAAHDDGRQLVRYLYRHHACVEVRHLAGARSRDHRQHSARGQEQARRAVAA